MAFRLVNTFEGGTASGTLSAGSGGNSGTLSGNLFDTAQVTGGATISYDNVRFVHGSRSLRFTTPLSAQNAWVRWTEGSVTTTTSTTAYCRMYLRIESLPSSDCRLIIFGDAGGLHLLAAINLRADGKFDLLDTNAAVLTTSTTVLALNQWHRIEAKVVSNAGAGSLDVKIFNPANLEGGTANETVSFSAANTNGSAVQWFNLGPSNGAANLIMNVDSLELTDLGYPAPFAPPVPSQYETLFANGTYPFRVPQVMDDNTDGASYTFGMAFTPSVGGKVYGAAWCNNIASTSVEGGLTPKIGLYPGPGGSTTALATKTATVSEVRANWNYELFTTPVSVTSGTTYMIAVYRTRYAYESFYFDASNGGHGDQTQGHLTAQGPSGTDNNFFVSPGGDIAKPTTAFHSSWYSIDVLFQADTSQAEFWGVPMS